MDTKTYFLQNDLGNKIRAALEQVIVGQGFSVFRGLENGMCIVKISYDGVNVSLENVTIEKSLIGTDFGARGDVGETMTTGPYDSALPEPVVDDPPNVTEETQTRRKGKRRTENE